MFYNSVVRHYKGLTVLTLKCTVKCEIKSPAGALEQCIEPDRSLNMPHWNQEKREK